MICFKTRSHKGWLTAVLPFAFQEMAFASHHVSFLMFLGHCLRGDIDAIRVILNENPEYAFELSTEGESCLHLAGVYGHAEITRMLLQGDDVVDSSHEPTHARENTSHPQRGGELGGRADVAELALADEDDSKLLSGSSQDPNIDAIAEDIYEEWSSKDKFEKVRAMPLQQGENRVDEL